MSTENTETVISINHVSKVYKLFEKPMDRLKESLSLTHKNYHTDHFAAGGYLARGAQKASVSVSLERTVPENPHC